MSDEDLSGKAESKRILYSLNEKMKYLQDIRHEIKRKRIFFDENKDSFGMSDMALLTKVKNTSQVKGYPFKAAHTNWTKTNGIKFGLKIVPVETKYDKKEHPSNLEYLILKELTENIVTKNISPHIAYYLGIQKVSNKSKALKILNLKRLEVEEKIRTHSNMLVSEFIEGGSLDSWVYNTYETNKDIGDDQWKSIIFQLTYTIAIIQHYYRMMHNDFHYGNVLIDDSVRPGGYFVYEIEGITYYIKNNGIIPKLWDFEFSMVYSNKMPDNYPNKFIIGSYDYDRKNHKTIVDELDDIETQDPTDINVPFNYNKVYDIHYFLTSLLDLYISQELFDWIVQLYPRELIPEDESSTCSTTSSSSSSRSSSSSSSSPSSSSSSGSNLDSSVTSSNETETNSSSNSSSNSSNTIQYLCDGRLINGVETLFNLPTPLELLKQDFFKNFTIRPKDFDEGTAIYFKAGF